MFISFQNRLWQKGWPLTLTDGSLVLHLGTIDESLVRLQDFYLCIRSGASNVSSKLFACWRTSISDSIVYHELDPDKRKSLWNFLSTCPLINLDFSLNRSNYTIINWDASGRRSTTSAANSARGCGTRHLSNTIRRIDISIISTMSKCIKLQRS